MEPCFFLRGACYSHLWDGLHLYRECFELYTAEQWDLGHKPHLLIWACSQWFPPVSPKCCIKNLRTPICCDSILCSFFPLSQLSGGCELTVVLQDFIASHSSELSIQVGQTVELLERPSERPGWCLVRTTERSPPLEGLVPSSALCISHSRSSVEMDCFFPSGKGKQDWLWFCCTSVERGERRAYSEAHALSGALAMEICSLYFWCLFATCTFCSSVNLI